MTVNEIEEVLLKMRFKDDYMLVLSNLPNEELGLYYQLQELGYVFIKYANHIGIIVVTLTELGFSIVNEKRNQTTNN